MPHAVQTDLTATHTGHRYRIFLSAPKRAPPLGGYPVVYVLDGNGSFPVAALVARQIARRSAVTGAPEALVVGVGYPGMGDTFVQQRRRDYTVGQAPADASANQGGADLLLDFIDGQLKPLVAAQHPVNPQRQALFGHSFGGLFTLHALFTRPGSFSHFIASSPSIWWRDQLVLKGLPRLAQTPLKQRPRVHISVGTLEDAPSQHPLPPERARLRAARPMLAPARQLAAELRALPGWRERVHYIELQGEDHGLAWMPALTRGMQSFLESPPSSSHSPVIPGN